MKNKKVTSILLASTLVMAAVLTTVPGNIVLAAESDDAENLTGELTIWDNNPSYSEELDALIELFNEKYPNVEISYDYKDSNDYPSIVKTAFQAGAAPDFMWTHGTKDSLMRDLVANDKLMDMSDVVDFSFCGDDALSICSIDNGIYSVPWLTLDTRTCYYNKDLFEENGWEVPTTIGELETLCQTIEDTTDIIPLSQALEPWYLEFLYEPMLAAAAPEYSKGLADYSVSVTDDTAREVLQRLVDWADAGYFGKNWTGVQSEDAMVLAFSSGKCAMMITGSWDNSIIKDNNPDLNFGAITIGNDESGAVGLVGTYSSGYSINKDTKNPEAAIAFANFLASKEAQQIYIQGSESVSGSSEIESMNEVADEMVNSSNGEVYAAWQSVISEHSEDAIASTIFSNNLTKVFTHEMTVDEYMDEIADNMD